MAGPVSQSRREGQLSRGRYSANRTGVLILHLDYSHDMFFFFFFFFFHFKYDTLYG